jgi:hypothetical protein
MPIIDNLVPSRLSYACSSCPACACAARNTAQEAVAAAVEAVRVSASSDAVPLTPPPAGFWGEAPTMGAYARDAQGAKDRDMRQAQSKAAQSVLHNVALGQHAERTFTRAEVLAVLKSREATPVRGITNPREYELATLITIFERME